MKKQNFITIIVKHIAQNTTKKTLKSFAFAIAMFAMAFMFVPIYMYSRTGDTTPFIKNAALISASLAVIAATISAVLHIAIQRETKEKGYVTPIERINTVYFTFCIITVIAIQAVIAAYLAWGYENFSIIQPVTLAGLIAVALIPLGVAFQLIVFIASRIEEHKRMKMKTMSK